MRVTQKKAVKLEKLSDEWYGVAKLSDFKEGKQTHPVILANNQAIVLYNIDGALFCSDANSTAFKFPLVNAEILKRAPTAWHQAQCCGCMHCQCEAEHVLPEQWLSYQLNLLGSNVLAGTTSLYFPHTHSHLKGARVQASP